MVMAKCRENIITRIEEENIFMKIIEPSVELVQELDTEKVMQHIERAGRVCYKSESRISDKSAEKFIANIIKSGHESVIEHVSVTFKIICDRGITHEIVRHRLASYCVTGDTIIPSYSKNKRISSKKRTIEEIYNWSQNPRCHAALKALVIRSFDEETHSIVPNKIKNVFYNGVQDVFELKTESGRSIKCTDGHRFFVNDGYKTLKEISVGDHIYSNGLPLLENEDWIRHNYLTLNKTRGQVAFEIGCCESTLYKAFKKFGIVKPAFLDKDSTKINVTWHRPYAIGAFKDKVIAINYVGKEKVYDLEMESPHHNYIANGIVVHNSQESSRYCDYSNDKFDGELTFIKPCFWNDDDENYKIWKESMAFLEKNYLTMRKNGARPEQARSILPNSLKTEIFMTANLREWRHFLKLRTANRAHPQMREVALKIYEILNEKLPVLFSDIKPE